MLDFWEIMGRVVANEDRLRDQLFQATFLLTPNTMVNCESAGAEVGQRIPSSQTDDTKNKYKILSNILKPYVKFQPISFFGQGEWLRALPVAGIEDQLKRLRESTTESLSGKSGEFYAGLGAIVSDDSFASDLASGAATLPLVSGAEADILGRLAGTVGTPQGFIDCATQVCARFWPPPCFVVVKPYAGNNSQLHPTLKGFASLVSTDFGARKR